MLSLVIAFLAGSKLSGWVLSGNESIYFSGKKLKDSADPILISVSPEYIILL